MVLGNGALAAQTTLRMPNKFVSAIDRTALQAIKAERILSSE